MMRKRKFWEFWADLEESNARLGITIYGLIILCAILSIIIGYTALFPKIYYIAAYQGGTGTAYPGLPEEAISQFASNYILLITNFTPATAKEAYSTARKYMSPSLISSLRVTLDEELKKIETNRISSHFAVIGNSQVQKLKESKYIVTIRGQKNSYIGSQIIASDLVGYDVHIMKASYSEINPFGLYVDQVSFFKEDKKG